MKTRIFKGRDKIEFMLLPGALFAHGTFVAGHPDAGARAYRFVVGWGYWGIGIELVINEPTTGGPDAAA